jgi:hypothetical protein
MMPLYIAVAVALICFILYALDRRFKGESIDWFAASKLTVLGGLLSGGIAYTVSSPEAVVEAVKSVVPDAPPPSQEMFVGVPTF